MTTSQNILDQMPAIRRIINRAEGRILDATGIRLTLDVKEIEDLNLTDNQLLAHIIQWCEIWKITYPVLIEKSRKREFVYPRFVTALLLNSMFGRKVSQSKMASLIGLKDHTSFIHGVQTAKDLIDTNDPLFMEYYLPVKHLFNEAETNK